LVLKRKTEDEILRGFEQKEEPESPERVLANFESLSDEDQLWVYEMIREWKE
jgi:hypothetical protein